MVALRYCRLVRQGVMRETVDSTVGDCQELQEHLLQLALDKAKSFSESLSNKHNPYAPGGDKAAICPHTNRP